jgi:hypothetical protein
MIKTLFRAAAVISLFLSFFLFSTSGHSACLETSPRIMDVQNDIAVDNTSGLIWQRCAVGTRWNVRMKQCDGQVKKLTHKEALLAARLAGSTWRLPGIRELNSLRLNKCRGPKIDTRIFPNINSSDIGEGINVWSSTTAISPDTFYFVNFSDGSLDFHSEGFSLAVLLVRNK